MEEIYFFGLTCWLSWHGMTQLTVHNNVKILTVRAAVNVPCYIVSYHTARIQRELQKLSECLLCVIVQYHINNQLIYYLNTYLDFDKLTNGM